jgi:hypothetical protein
VPHPPGRRSRHQIYRRIRHDGDASTDRAHRKLFASHFAVFDSRDGWGATGPLARQLNIGRSRHPALIRIVHPTRSRTSFDKSIPRACTIVAPKSSNLTGLRTR